MQDSNLIITPKKYFNEKVPLTVSIPKSVLDEIDKISEKTLRSRSEIFLECVEFALEHLEISDKYNK